jgi:hypothetical protein
LDDIGTPFRAELTDRNKSHFGFGVDLPRNALAIGSVSGSTMPRALNAGLMDDRVRAPVEPLFNPFDAARIQGASVPHSHR